MRKRLGKISQLPPERRRVFLGQQADIITERQQALEKISRFGDASLQNVVVREPEAAGEECTFARGEPVHAFSGVISHHKPVNEEIFLDRVDGTDDTRVGGRQEADERHKQQARIERFEP